MLNIIKLLPDSVANQIAAGEVIQRPASVVKELIENALDAGATDISLVIKDAGKTLIQVIDNGSGMTPVDARMSFERHATSKINKADDLFSIRTMGFRGEALASIAAIAQVELKTRPHGDELGTYLKIEGSKVISQEPCHCNPGTNFQVKNLFFNVPARRNFLKSNIAESRNIIEEFIRVSVFHYSVSMSMVHSDKVIFKLPQGNLKSRIMGLFGNAYNQRLLPVEQKTDLLMVKGFISKPENVKKTRGEQYFFVNGRYIRHTYLHHAVSNAFTELISADSFPSYFIDIEIDPSEIDINIHPTKTEINFKNSQYVYAVIHAAVKQAIGKHSLTPTIDFNPDPAFEAAFQQFPKHVPSQPEVKINPDYDPFKKNVSNWAGKFDYEKPKGDQNWENLYAGHKETKEEETPEEFPGKLIEPSKNQERSGFFQLHNRFILCNVRSGLLVIEQQGAIERIVYEDVLEQLTGEKVISQQQLFPQTVRFSPGDAEIIRSLNSELKRIGFILHEFGTNSFVAEGIPADLPGSDIMAVLEKIIENFKLQAKDLNVDKNTILARSIASNRGFRSLKKLTELEMADIVDRLFACQLPEVSPGGKKILTILGVNEIEKLIRK